MDQFIVNKKEKEIEKQLKSVKVKVFETRAQLAKCRSFLGEQNQKVTLLKEKLHLEENQQRLLSVRWKKVQEEIAAYKQMKEERRKREEKERVEEERKRKERKEERERRKAIERAEKLKREKMKPLTAFGFSIQKGRKRKEREEGKERRVGEGGKKKIKVEEGKIKEEGEQEKVETKKRQKHVVTVEQYPFEPHYSPVATRKRTNTLLLSAKRKLHYGMALDAKEMEVIAYEREGEGGEGKEEDLFQYVYHFSGSKDEEKRGK